MCSQIVRSAEYIGMWLCDPLCDVFPFSQLAGGSVAAVAAITSGPDHVRGCDVHYGSQKSQVAFKIIKMKYNENA